jgi:hypothetical protein
VAVLVAVLLLPLEAAAPSEVLLLLLLFVCPQP